MGGTTKRKRLQTTSPDALLISRLKLSTKSRRSTIPIRDSEVEMRPYHDKLYYKITSYEEASQWHMGDSGPVDEIGSFLASLDEIRARRVG